MAYESQSAPSATDEFELEVIPRKEFCKEFAREYRKGKWGGHVTILGPTQRGKTRLCHDLLNEVITPEHRAILLSGKPPGRDPTMAEAAKRLDLRVIEQWPPSYSYKDRKRRGWVLRPYYDINLDTTEAEILLHDEFKRGMDSAYRSNKPVILVVDEAHQVQNDLKLKKEYEAPLMRGAPVCAEWSLIQRGRFMSYHAYCEPEHLFIFHDPDRNNRQRYSEIGGVDPRKLVELTEGLKTYTSKSGGTISEALYIRRSGPRLSIVDVK